MLHSFDDVLITRATAEVALELLANLLLAGVGVFLAKVDSAHHHAGGAETALQAMAFFKCRLHGVHRAVCLDRKSTRLNSSHSQQSRMPSSA